MGISKAWLEEKIRKYGDESAESSDSNMASFLKGKQQAFQECYEQLTKPPIPKKELTNEDINKGFDSIVKYYIDKKGYTKEHANEIAIQCIKEQKQKILEQSLH